MSFELNLFADGLIIVCICFRFVFAAGVIDFLVSQHPIAQVLRDHVVFKIVPMLNPDGVYLGNYRSESNQSQREYRLKEWLAENDLKMNSVIIDLYPV